MKHRIFKEIGYLNKCFTETMKREQEKIDLQKERNNKRGSSD
jgi:hypothetical protein